MAVPAPAAGARGPRPLVFAAVTFVLMLVVGVRRPSCVGQAAAGHPRHHAVGARTRCGRSSGSRCTSRWSRCSRSGSASSSAAPRAASPPCSACCWCCPASASCCPTSWQPHVLPYLPSNAGAGRLLGADRAGHARTWTGFAVLCAWAAAALVIGASPAPAARRLSSRSRRASRSGMAWRGPGVRRPPAAPSTRLVRGGRCWLRRRSPATRASSAHGPARRRWAASPPRSSCRWSGGGVRPWRSSACWPSWPWCSGPSGCGSRPTSPCWSRSTPWPPPSPAGSRARGASRCWRSGSCSPRSGSRPAGDAVGSLRLPLRPGGRGVLRRARRVRNRRAYLGALVDRAARVERERDQQARLAATAERTRIARELHDIVAHSLTVMVTLAEAAAASARDRSARPPGPRWGRWRRPAARRWARCAGCSACCAPNRASRWPISRPQPGLDGVDELVAGARAAGLPVRLTVAGRPAPAARRHGRHRLPRSSRRRSPTCSSTPSTPSAVEVLAALGGRWPRAAGRRRRPVRGGARASPATA